MRQLTHILIVDDSSDVRSDLHTLLDLMDGIEVVGEAANAESAIQQAVATQPDIVLVDLDLGGKRKMVRSQNPNEMEGYQAIRQLKASPQAPLVYVLTVHGYSEAERAARQAGADGFFVKGRDIDALLEAIRGYKATIEQ